MRDLYANGYTLYDMEHRGIRVDRKALDDYSVKLQSRIDELHTDIIGYAGKEFNINSPKQLGVILFEDMGIFLLWQEDQDQYSSNT